MRLTVLFFVFVTTAIQAQNVAVTNAILYYQEGNLEKAKEEIDLAVVNDKTKKSAKAWYYRGLVYEGIAHSQNAAYSKLSDHAADEAYLSWNNAVRFDTAGKKEYARKSREDRVRIWPDYVNSGTDFLKNRKYDEALTQYDIAQELNPKDTVAYIYGSIAAAYKPDYVRLDRYTDSLLKYSPSAKPDLFLNKSAATREVRKDTAEAISWCDKGLKKYPGNEALSREKGWMLAATGKKQEAIGVLAPFAENSKDQDYLNFLAGLYENTGQSSEAVKIYQRIVVLNPNDATAWYNISAIQYNQGNELYKAGKKEEAKVLYKSCQASTETALRLSTSADDKTTLNYILTDVKNKLK
jgi:tetratricopeptide (TPR) repeat protein